MEQPLCANRSDGKCPSFALNGTPNCMQHANAAGIFDKIDIGYRPGGLDAAHPVSAVDQDALTAPLAEASHSSPRLT